MRSRAKNFSIYIIYSSCSTLKNFTILVPFLVSKECPANNSNNILYASKRICTYLNHRYVTTKRNSLLHKRAEIL